MFELSDLQPLPDGWELVEHTSRHIAWHNGELSVRIADYSIPGDSNESWDAERADFSIPTGAITHKRGALSNRLEAMQVARTFMLKNTPQ